MVEIYPVVKVSNLEESLAIDFNPGFNGYVINGFPTINADPSESWYNAPNFSKSATLSVFALPTDSITFQAPNSIVLRFDNSFNYVSSGGGYRNAYLRTFKIPHTPVIPKGSGQVLMVWKTDKINWLYYNNLHVYKSYPYWDVQDTSIYSTTSTTDYELFRIDFGSVGYGDFIGYAGIWSSRTGYSSIVSFQVSDDGTSWTTTNQLAWSDTTERFGYCIANNVPFRYLRVTLRISSSSQTAYTRIRKLLVFR
jgi:hypothetical protein